VLRVWILALGFSISISAQFSDRNRSGQRRPRQNTIELTLDARRSVPRFALGILHSVAMCAAQALAESKRPPVGRPELQLVDLVFSRAYSGIAFSSAAPSASLIAL
jgi:hypothetical protein